MRSGKTKANDLFLLMLNLSQISLREKIIDIFLEAITEIWQNITPEYSPFYSESQNNSIEISTVGSNYGFISIDNFNALKTEDQDLLHNACGMLAVILRKNEHEALLADEKLHLNTLVEKRTHHLNKEIHDRKQAEQKLLESEHKLATHLQNTPVGALSWDLNFKATGWNPAAEAIFGYSKAEAMGRHSTELILPEELKEMVNGVYRDLISGKGGTRSTNENITKDGRRIMCDWYNTVLKDADGKVIGAASLVQDITESKKAEESLRESEKKHRTLFENMVQGVFYQRTDGVLVDFNNATLEMFGLSSDQFLGRTSLDPQWKVIDEDGGILPGDKHPSMVALQTGKPLRDKIVGVYNPLTKYYKWLVVNAIPQFNKGEKKPYQVFVTLQDITEQKKAAIEIIKAKKKAERYLNLAGVMFIGLDRDENINVANIKACQILEVQQKDILGQKWFDNFIPQNTRQEVRSVFRQLIDGTIEPVEYFENLIITKTGKEKQIAWHNTILKDDDGSIIGILSSGEDITEKKQLQFKLQQAQKMESIGNLAGGIAHDFNNLLYPIIGFAEILKEDLPPDSPEYESAQEIFNAGKRGGELVKQILAFSRQSDHKLQPVRVQKVLKEVLKLTRSSIPSDIEIHQEIQQDCYSVMAEATQLHQIAINLITNAYHAVEYTSGIISVQLKEIRMDAGELKDSPLKPGEYVMLSVSDNGSGIPRNVINNIFEPYFTTKEKGKGTGLGLAVVYGIVKEHKGDIKVYSEEGKGTTFNVYLPLMEKSTETVANEPVSILPTGTERLLLVDDEKSVVRLEKQMLERLGYNVVTQSSSIDALEIFKASPDNYDLVVTDMTMPNMTGDKLAKEILAVRSDMPVIICTGFSERINKEQAEVLGVKGFLMKPVVKSEMAQMVRKALDEARVYKEN